MPFAVAPPTGFSAWRMIMARGGISLPIGPTRAETPLCAVNPHGADPLRTSRDARDGERPFQQFVAESANVVSVYVRSGHKARAASGGGQFRDVY